MFEDVVEFKKSEGKFFVLYKGDSEHTEITSEEAAQYLSWIYTSN
jgi:hypothetical protein